MLTCISTYRHDYVHKSLQSHHSFVSSDGFSKMEKFLQKPLQYPTLRSQYLPIYSGLKLTLKSESWVHMIYIDKL